MRQTAGLRLTRSSARRSAPGPCVRSDETGHSFLQHPGGDLEVGGDEPLRPPCKTKHRTNSGRPVLAEVGLRCAQASVT